MGQAPSQLTRRSSGAAVEATAGPSSVIREKSPDDPFHRSPISPTLHPTSVPPPPPPAPTLETRPSFIKLRKTISPESNLPKPPTASLSSRVVRKISKSRKDLAVVRVGSGSGLAPTDPSAPPPTLLHHPDFRPSSYGRYPPLAPNPKLSSSLGSSTLSGPSTSLVTPSASRRNLISPTPAAPCTPAHQIRPYPSQHHRRGSSASSGKSLSATGKPAAHSPKTRTRAEREWRARVAAISAGAKARGTSGEEVKKVGGGESPAYKGPVPPRRRGGPQASISAIPTAPQLVESSRVPPHIVLPDDSSFSLRRSLSSARSFETLGHHAHVPRPSSFANGSPSHVQYRSIPLSPAGGSPLSHHRAHSRKGSLPQSIGSFYADPTNRGGTRPNSLAASTFLSPLRPVGAAVENGAGDEQPVATGQDAVEEEDEEELPLGMGAGKMARLSKDSNKARQAETDNLLFDMTLAQPPSPSRPPASLLSNIPTRPIIPTPTPLPTSSRTPTRGPDVPRRASAEHTPPPSIAFGQGPETPRSRARKERILSLPSIDTSPQRTPTRVAVPRFAIPSQPPIAAPSPPLQADTSLTTDTTSPSLPSLLSYALSTPTPTKQSASGSAATPTTPYSPMTAYILSAPSIDLTFPIGDSVPTSPQGWMVKGYTSGAAEAKKGDKASLHPFASVLDAPSPPRVQGGMRAENEARRAGPRDGAKGIVIKGEETRPPVQYKSTQLPPSRKPLPHPSSTARSAHPLRPKTPNGLPTARDAVLGAADRQERTRGKVEVDLCPGQGIGGGVRPPKRGMDMSDLEKWLAGTKA